MATQKANFVRKSVKKKSKKCAVNFYQVSISIYQDIDILLFVSVSMHGCHYLHLSEYIN